MCLTLDTDPDGLNTRTPDRQSLQWEGLERIQRLPEALAECPTLENMPITWFVRGDGQLESILGSAAYLLETYDAFWTAVTRSGHEVAWHPHLYRQARPEDPAVIITDVGEACDELERLWSKLKAHLRSTSFRNGEGWHLPETYATVEKMGFRCDSTAIPGRRGVNGHPMNWEDAPNHPYFPGIEDLCLAGPERTMPELPMTTWAITAPFDTSPRIRYMNPAVHPHLFAEALVRWEDECAALTGDLCVWVMIFHPDEVLASRGPDALYSRSVKDLTANLVSITESVQRVGDDFGWITVSEAAECWRLHQRQSGL